MLELVLNILTTIVMAMWLAGSAFLGYVLSDGNEKLATRLQAASVVAWCIVAANIYIY